jgi:ABC-type nickel/cobalt efflux system permease component RcnA
VSVLAQILLAIVGAIGVYIAWRQWRTAQDKAKLEVSEDRQKAYQKLRDAVAPVTASGKVRNEDCDAFAQAMHDMHFLFDKSIEREAMDIYHAMLRKHALDSQLDHAADRQKALIKSNELFVRITKGVYDTIPERMEKLMRFSSGI